MVINTIGRAADNDNLPALCGCVCMLCHAFFCSQFEAIFLYSYSKSKKKRFASVLRQFVVNVWKIMKRKLEEIVPKGRERGRKKTQRMSDTLTRVLAKHVRKMLRYNIEIVCKKN